MKHKFDLFDVNIRIMQIMREKKLNKNSLSKLLDLSQPALTKIERNQNLPSFKLLFELTQTFPDINAEWLLTGEGQMIKSMLHIKSEEDDLKIEPTDKFDVMDLFAMLRQSQDQVDTLTTMLKQSQRQLDDVLKMYTQLLEREKKGGVAHRGNDAGCADVG
jgi:DNA-binding XRE family transcriptional regulator